MSRKLNLNCLVFGDDTIFSVQIRRTESVDVLKKVIKRKKKPAFDHIPADKLTLWKVSFSVTPSLREDLSKHEFVDEESLSPVAKLSGIFSQAPIRENLHIVVKVSPTALRMNAFVASPVIHPAPPPVLYSQTVVLCAR
ncbi:hypothetical protein M378DRAFT_170864 [Amanita muscaria Koide BX008]|uniref:Crinkler effector protein N-terminal domain-containing protein n=1 Tax=Amanita muscaria (strain Koide BX008) TaxID=946122 RepID=A0A0C2WPP2_AMAMK|nr:hypothetical protein M378DRAFT_170864 [Amanita muscaria Koide BX008]